MYHNKDMKAREEIVPVDVGAGRARKQSLRDGHFPLTCILE